MHVVILHKAFFRIDVTSQEDGNVGRRSRCVGRRTNYLHKSTRRFSARLDMLISTQDYFKCFLLQGAVYRGLDALDPIIDANDL